MEVFEAKLQDDQETFEPIGEFYLSVGHAAEEDRMDTEPVGEAGNSVWTEGPTNRLEVLV